MSKCALKTLKVTFDNPNLPVLEKMQQFTLDAISLSGNNDMSDEQKIALNHFFYQIGAIGNTSLWRKIKFLFLPMICGDNVETALNDYVNNIVVAAAGSPTFVNHGLHYEIAPSTQIIGTDIFSGSSNNLTLFQATMKSSFPKTPGFSFMIDKGSSTDRRTFNGIALGATENYYTANLPGVAKQLPVTKVSYDLGCVVSDSDSAYAIISDSQDSSYIKVDFTASDLSSRTSEVVYNENYLRLGMGGDLNLGLLMAAEALTNEESLKCLNAIKDLKSTFSGSNT